jgi:hypothetical protein
MMALLTRSFCEREGAFDSAPAVAEQYAWQVAQYLVPEKYKKEFEQFKPKRLLSNESRATLNGFLITTSRKEVVGLLDELLLLHAFKRSNSSNEAVCYGGLGGFIIEGEPGIGKSELVLARLLAEGYQEGDYQNDLSDSLSPDKFFYRMPASLSIEEQKAFYLKAFHEGAIVVVDEINSTSGMERFLNHLLMGKTAEGERPKNPGFLLIGTQNSASMGGREELGNALARRFLTVNLPQYPQEEVEAILVDKGVQKYKINALAKAFATNLQKAARENLKPSPTVRDLLRVGMRAEQGWKCNSSDNNANKKKHAFFLQQEEGVTKTMPLAPLL